MFVEYEMIQNYTNYFSYVQQKILITLTIGFYNECYRYGEYQNFTFVLSYIISLCHILYKCKQFFNKIILILQVCDNEFKAHIIKKDKQKLIDIELHWLWSKISSIMQYLFIYNNLGFIKNIFLKYKLVWLVLNHYSIS